PGIGELAEMKPSEREPGLGPRIRGVDSAGHAHGLMETLGSQRPLALLDLPRATETVKKSHGLAVLACGGQSFCNRKMLLPQVSLPKPTPSVKALRFAGPVTGARPIAAHGIKKLPHGFGFRPLSSQGEFVKSRQPASEKLFIIQQCGE